MVVSIFDLDGKNSGSNRNIYFLGVPVKLTTVVFQILTLCLLITNIFVLINQKFLTKGVAEYLFSLKKTIDKISSEITFIYII